MCADRNTCIGQRVEPPGRQHYGLAAISWSDATAVLTIVGLVGYLVARAFVDGFFYQFRLSAEDVGVSYGWLLSRLAVPYGYFLGIMVLVWSLIGTAILKKPMTTRGAPAVRFLSLAFAPLVSYLAFVAWLYQVTASSSIADISLELLLAASGLSIICVVFSALVVGGRGSPGVEGVARFLRVPAVVSVLIVITYLGASYAGALKAGALTAGSIVQGAEVHRVGFDLHQVKITGQATDRTPIEGRCLILLGVANSIVILYDQADQNVWQLPVGGVVLQDDPFSSDCPPRR